ncbi:MAG: hypothetical protein M0R76_09820 [Proteobacteria bacterium]|nr:hypothetical protein [Pseudomonadota bacterium]
MSYNPDIHHRRSIRLRDYDYAQSGAYFITICTQDRECLFGEVVNGQMRMNDAGRMIQAIWDEIPAHYPGVDIDEFVVMPDHVHGIIIISGHPAAAVVEKTNETLSHETGQPQGVAPTTMTTTTMTMATTTALSNETLSNETGQPQGVAPTTMTTMTTLSNSSHPAAVVVKTGQPQGVAPTTMTTTTTLSNSPHPAAAVVKTGQPQGVAPTTLPTPLSNSPHPAAAVVEKTNETGQPQGVAPTTMTTMTTTTTLSNSPHPAAVVVKTGQPQGVAPTTMTTMTMAMTLSLPDVVHRFKTMTTKRYIDGVKQNRWTPFRGKLWQRNYYERVIRNEPELQEFRAYIHQNPATIQESPALYGQVPSLEQTPALEQASLTPYPKYTSYTNRNAHVGERTIPWLATLPDHWEVIRSKRLFAVRKERARQDDVQLSATQAYGVIPQKDFESKIGRKVVRISLHLEKRAHVEPDDFVISMRSFQGGLERAWARGCIRSSYVVLNPMPLAHIGYFAHLFKSQNYISALQATSNFIRDGQDLNFNNFCLVDLPLPPQQEQNQIARFLDWKTAQINKFIRNKRRLIALLKEQKQNIINQAVTQGLDPNVKRKPSGVKWIGDIPKHWEVIKLRNLLKPVSIRNRPDLPLLSVVRERGIIVRDVNDLEENHNFIPDDLSNYKVVHKGQFAMNKMKAWQGSYGISEYDGIVSPAYFIFEMFGKISPRFFHLAIRSKAYVPFFTRASDGVRIGQWDLSIPRMKEIPFFIPTAVEQDEIGNFILKRHLVIDQAISRAEREIDLIREYRTRLISDVVTGQVDVRGIAVPEITENELLALDDDVDDADDTDAVIDEEEDNDEID